MKKEYQQVFEANIGGPNIRREMLDGVEHVVAPASMLEEGVWKGAGDAGVPTYYPAQSLMNSVSGWDHKPLVVYHPKKKGKHVTACSPDILNTRKIGVLLNTRHDDKLRTEAWINPQRADQVDRRIMQAVNANKVMELSTGMYADVELASGEFEGKSYEQVAHNLYPDHLAILPDQKGAYSVKSGGGLLQVHSDPDEPESVNEMIERTLKSNLPQLGLQLVANQLSFTDISRQLSEVLANKFGKPGRYWHGNIFEVFNNAVIFGMDDGKPGMYKIGYSVKDNLVVLNGEATEVKRVIEYKANEESYARNSSGELVTLTTEEGMSFKKNEHLASLKESGWTDTEIAEVEKLPDAVLQKIQPKAKSPASNLLNEGGDDGKPAPTPTPTPPTEKKQTWEEIIANADSGTREALEEMKSTLDEQRTELVKTLKANSAGVKFEDDYLAKKSIKELKMLAALSVGGKKAESKSGSKNSDGFTLPASFVGLSGGSEDLSEEDTGPPEGPLVANRTFKANAKTKKKQKQESEEEEEAAVA